MSHNINTDDVFHPKPFPSLSQNQERTENCPRDRWWHLLLVPLPWATRDPPRAISPLPTNLLSLKGTEVVRSREKENEEGE